MKALLHLFLAFCAVNTLAQYPQNFTYNSENGLPSNEVYSIVQDKKGFIWIGCDAGLFKFDGVKYTPYRSKTQTSKSITGLTVSSSGKIYCYNFQAQLFYLDNESGVQTLKELKHPFPKIIINSLVSDRENNIYVSYLGGISQYNAKTERWHNYFNYKNVVNYVASTWAAKSVKGNERTAIPFIYPKGIASIENNSVKLIYNSNSFTNNSTGKFEIENHQNTLWIFAKENGTIYRFANHTLEQLSDTKLQKVLSGIKINSVKSLPDGNLWICTYKGVVCFNPKTNMVRLFYPDLSFSDCLIDREGNYWFTTLQDGILRVPDLNFNVWEQNRKLTKITSDSTHIYFAEQKGEIGKFNINTKNTTLFHTGYSADIQSFDYDTSNNTLWFNINNHLFELNNNTLKETHNFNIQAVKSVKKIEGSVFIASSHGTFINSKHVNLNWARQIKHNAINKCVWIATNRGLLKFIYTNKEWKLSNTLFSGVQILSIDFAPKEKLLYALTFDGKIFVIDNNNTAVEIAKMPKNAQVNKLIHYKQKLYVSSNAGIALFNLNHVKNPEPKFINRLSGLVSDHVQDITIANNSLWIATTKGLQQISLNRLTAQKPLARIYLNAHKNLASIQLKYGQSLTLFPEVSSYSSNGKFDYAYRINRNDTTNIGWVKLPSTIEQIEIQNIPTGNFTIALKAIDHLGRDSENTILLQGFVKPPFWLTWWFALCIIILLVILVYWLLKQRIKKLQQKQQEEIERIQLENELRLSRETALKSQMNPHFVFNVLNSIKSYIYKNDKQKASNYLNKFSDLIRTFLSMSNKPLISLADELKMLELYISMEAMLLQGDFSYQKNVDKNIILEQTKIPSLIIQPFIENAFKHGLHNKVGDKKLILSIFETEQNYITIEIIDNGIGRQAAQELKEAEELNHESFATAAIEKRIELLNRNKQTVAVSINDLYDEYQQPNGTKVMLKIVTDE